ncbi:SrfA family protein [[Erwinia] mediterraneensis]|uniref:SrfA family protein n=1 Tax=[Erwinia] mediterraneensis TaxID=2161819 RepID=UPI001030311E|nr:SrfA family protein [[Erwinia] mediterraneensis]
MRNSIQGPLLRSGNNSAFKALGETGYPVFKMAFQLREAIYRLDAGRDLARHLAVPQNDQGGDRTDWYSSFAGDVIPWQSATESERASARQQFDAFQMAVQALSEQMLNAENSHAGGDRRVFAQLLTSVVHFPGNEFLYLVNGVLVITFWGFIQPTGEQRNPMHWLQSSSVAEQPLAAPFAQPLTQPQPQPAAPPVQANGSVTHPRRRNWHWWRWLLLPLLCLALILGLLRGCVPSLSLPGLPGFSAEKNLSQPVHTAGDSHIPGENSLASSSVNVPLTSGATSAAPPVPAAGSAGTNAAPDGVFAPAAGDAAANDVPTQEATDKANGAQEQLNNSEAPVTGSAADTVPPVIPEGQPPAPQQPAAVPNTVPPVIPAQGKPLTLPAALPDGPAQFLNGQWRVNGGIQDKLTGRPLQLQYNFKQGNGTVSVRQSNGVTCTGAARGSVRLGALNITNPEQMQCSDGSNFIGPTIECKSPASGHADCVGNNEGDKTFPIRMLQPNT